MLFREILVDPLLSRCVSFLAPEDGDADSTCHRYSVIMVDEAHERSVYTDLLLGVLKKCSASTDPALYTLLKPPSTCRIRRVRPSLRIIISSATIDAQAFVDFFNTQPPSSSVPSSGIKPADEMLPPPSKKSRWDKKEKIAKDDAVMVRLEGRAFPVEIAYLEEPTADLVQKVVETVYEIHLQVRGRFSSVVFPTLTSPILQQPPGDILVFLTGREEIDRCLQALADNMSR